MAPGRPGPSTGLGQRAPTWGSWGQRQKEEGALPSLLRVWSGVPPERRQAVFSFSFPFKSFPAAAVSCHAPWRPPRGMRGPVVSQDSGKKPQRDRDKGSRALMGQ